MQMTWCMRVFVDQAPVVATAYDPSKILRRIVITLDHLEDIRLAISNTNELRSWMPLSDLLSVFVCFKPPQRLLLFDRQCLSIISFGRAKVASPPFGAERAKWCSAGSESNQRMQQLTESRTAVQWPRSIDLYFGAS